MLKNAFFGEKTRKFFSASWAGVPPPDPRIVTSAYYYNFVEFVSSTKCILLRLKKETNNYSKYSAFAFFALLHLFFNSNSVSFIEGGARIFLALGRKVP